MTFIFELGLDVLRPDLHPKIQVCISVHTSTIVRHQGGSKKTFFRKVNLPMHVDWCSFLCINKGKNSLFCFFLDLCP